MQRNNSSNSSLLALQSCRTYLSRQQSNHRQFFHDVAFAGLLGIVTRKVYCWKPDNLTDETVRFPSAGMRVRLFRSSPLDAGIPKSLPLIGKLK